MTRIVSLLPAVTETLFAIGRGDEVVGVTHECDHPAEAASRPAVTSDLLPHGLTSAQIDEAVVDSLGDVHTIYRLDEERLVELDPDLIVTQALCEVCAVPTARVKEAVCTMPRRARVLSSDPETLEGVLEGIVEIGQAVEAGDAARELVGELRTRIRTVERAVSGRPRPRTVVLEWPDPPYAPGHWVPDMVEAAGGQNALGESGRPSRRTSWEEVLEADPEVVVLGFCGFDLARTIERLEEIEGRPEWERLLSRARVVALDGSAYVSRPGPRLVDGVELLAWLLHRPGELLPPGPSQATILTRRERAG